MSEVNTVVITDKEVAKDTSPAVVPTREELKDKGWSAKELDAAEKQGVIKAVDEKKPVEKKEEKKEEAKPEPVLQEKKEHEARPANFLDVMDKELTPEQEKVFLEVFPPGTKPRAFYFRAKNERTGRQVAESERDKALQRIKELEDRDAKAVPSPKTEADGDDGIDPEDRPLTLRQIREMREQEAKELEEKQRDLDQRSSRVAEAHKAQEEFARSVYADFDDTVKLAADLMKNLDEHIPERYQQERVKVLIRELQVRAANADKIGVDDFNAAMVAHEIGRLHPQYGKKADTNGKSDRPDSKANGGLTADQMKRMEENTTRRTSSASIPGGSGRRTVSVDDVTLKDINNMTSTERIAFRDKHPERYKNILRE